MRERRATGKPMVLMLAYHFAPDNSSGTHRSLHFAKTLRAAGYAVRVLTTVLAELDRLDADLSRVFPHPEEIVRVPKSWTLGRAYLRLKGLRGGTSPDQERGNPGPATTTRPASLGSVLRRRISAWDSFPDEHRGWYRPAVRAGVALGQTLGVDLIYTSGPPWTAVLAAEAIARRLRKPLAIDYRDPWTEKLGRDNAYGELSSRVAAERHERRILQRAELVLFATPGLRARATQSYGSVGRAEFKVIMNGSDVPLSHDTIALDPSSTLSFRHFGSLYGGRSLAQLVDGLKLALRSSAESTPGVRIEQIGSPVGPEPVQGSLPPPPEIRVTHRPELPFSEAAKLMAEPAVLVVSQPATFRYQIPTKLFDYLCTGNPVLVIAPEDCDTWAVARRYPQCRRIEHEGGIEEAAATLRALIATWQSGTLRREPTVETASELTKAATGAQFIAVIGDLFRRHGMPG